MKKYFILSMLLAVGMMVAAQTPWNGTVAEAYDGGDGTLENPYQIATAEQLALLAYETNNGLGGDACYVLTNDIDLNAADSIIWIPIGNEEKFSGVFDGDGHTRLISSSMSGDAVAKITVVYPTGENTYAHTYWYLAADGSISNSAPANRADGKWALIEIGEDDDQREKVQELVDGNARSYKIEFWSDVDMAVGDTYRMRLNGAVFDGVVTAKFLSSADNRIRYSSGDLATTLTERVNKIGGNK